MTLDQRRLRRALQLEVTPGGPGCYRVTGGNAAHLVRRLAPGQWSCDCADSLFRTSDKCKHVIAVYLTRRLAPSVLQGLRNLVTTPSRAPSIEARRAHA